MEITCASCGTAHPATARFCSACGAALYTPCPHCGTEQSASAAFCSACGGAIAAPAAPRVPTDERQERRVVTVLFADLAGSTALGERLDPEDFRMLQSELFRLVDAEVARFGGVTEKFVGDAVVAVFGVPRTHEDDSERAVRAGLAMQEAFGPFARWVHERHRAKVALRVGVNTGEVVAGREAAARGELIVSGDAVNVAARLQQSAEPGEVLVGSRTQRATARSVAYRGKRTLEAKGKSDPLDAWIAESATAGPAARGIGGLTAPLIGRTDELAIVTALARRVARERTPQLVTLFGPAGVGKSRFLSELLARMPEWTVLVGRCLPYGDDVTYWPIAEAARLQAKVLDSDDGTTARAKLTSAVASVAGEETDEIVEPLFWTLGLGLPERAVGASEVTQRLHDAWRRYLTALGAGAPVVLAVEDVHWASPELLDLLEQLADTLADAKVLVVCTARIELLENRPSWGASKQNATALTLGPLGNEEATALVNALLGREGPLGELGERVLERAEGNPFFVEEMIAMLIERGVLVQVNGDWRAKDDRAEVPLPDSVHGVLAARVDLLDDDARDALRRCSVVGRVFWPAAVAVDEEAIAPLTVRGLVSERPSSMTGRREFAFKHALTRDVAYASLPRPERRVLHRMVAEWIQEIAPDRGLEVAELAGHHYAESLAYGEDVAAVAARAGPLFLAAGEGALQRGSFGAATRSLERVLELPVADEVRASALVDLAELRVLAAYGGEFRLEGALDRLTEALSLMPADAVELRSEGLAWRSRVLWLTGDWAGALAAADDAVATLHGRAESAQLARALARRSQIAMLRDRPEAESLAREALAVAERVDDRFAVVNARINLMSVLALEGTAPDPDDALAILGAAREIGANEEAYRILVNFIWSAAGYLRVDDVLGTVATGYERLHGRPLPTGLEWYLPLSVALVHLLPAGRLDELDASLAASEPAQLNMTNRIPWLGLAAQLRVRRGDVEAAEALVEEQLGLAVASGEPQRIIPMACAYLPWAALAGRTDRLRAVAAQIVELVDGRWSATVTALPAVRALAAAGEFELLASWLESFLRRDRAIAAARLAATVAATRGLLAMHAGRADEAVVLLGDSVARDRAVGYELDAAMTELDLAAALEASGDDERAAGVRARATAFLDSIGCVNAL